MPIKQEAAVSVDLTAVIVAVTGDAPNILTIRAGGETRRAEAGSGTGDGLPSGPLQLAHPTLESGLRAWVREQAGIELGYVEQLYTFGDRNRSGKTRGRRHLSLGYLALTRQTEPAPEAASWEDWYRYFPWEDWRQGKPEILRRIRAGLGRWAAAAPRGEQMLRRDRIALLFGAEDAGWTQEHVLERYELLYEAGLIAEAARETGERAVPAATGTGRSMIGDHRRILATAIGRLRGKIKYRPVVFELMPQGFTLLQLQRAVEALIGAHLHKQNFRRLVEEQGLVEETGRMVTGTGRPAREVRFRADVLLERPALGQRLPILR